MAHAVTGEGVGEFSSWIAAQPREQLIRQDTIYGSDSNIPTAWASISCVRAEMIVELTFAGVPFPLTNLVDGLGFFLQFKEGNGDLIVALALGEHVWAA
ncbi:hypothetical protein BN1708_012508 [Verticillium longisporum]|uniref:Uncharacterized protein n=1 Tax=Verticillium longisporum TaxID=100787 RepID=A0A0G4LAU1_VERLO|nr:hypothetical protein BN1708_012508 [Verticillium longisporum]